MLSKVIYALFFAVLTVHVVRGQQFADQFTQGTILDSWGGNLGPNNPNSVQSRLSYQNPGYYGARYNYNNYYGNGFFG
ncbi:unnamed protein product [Bursaphelenchus xylophilus]|uniref:(pine wood nematode) hypothetical protein n=1 Tax=Bursaphelenchus xylophilus TaxID=6326 RepID=A0A1I7RJG8_BURXY|nr:unnamed protein product [Bursaphelenchus xylophilus]CAG9128875.1 unnamed protein product [Bursaphelenchus xylophilus]